MSSKPADSISLERVASRRNVIRSAAWTTAAVTVVVATPNIAAATTTGTASGGAARASQAVSVRATLTNGTVAIAANTLTVEVLGGTLAAAPLGWNRVTGTQFKYVAQIAANGAAVFGTTAAPAQLQLANNGKKQDVVLTFKAGALTLDTLTYSFNSQTETVNGV